MSTSVSNKKYMPVIIAASVIIPIAVAILFFMPKIDIGSKLTILPLFNAIINGSTAIILILALRAIKAKNIELHRKLMTSAIVLSVLFLLSYITYHATSDSTVFGGEGMIKNVYYFILLSHILLSIIVVPFVLISYVRALSERFDKHKKIAKITWPIWLYVTVTGVLVYILISPYY